MFRSTRQLLRAGLVFAVSLVVILALALPAPARSASTSGSTQASPSPRDVAGMACDAARGQVVLFGGYSDGALGDTWTWDGTGWTKLSPAHSPSPRYGMAMAYDAAHGQVVLFGGASRSYNDLGDTWTWDGTDWTKQSPAHSPSARAFASMAFDAVRAEVVLFGSAYGAPADTWTWDGTDWTQRNPAHSPSPRGAGGMAYDAIRGQVVLFGGWKDVSFADTWTWDGTDWTKRTSAHSPKWRQSMGMAYDASRGRVVLFGGRDGDYFDRYLNDTWTWDGIDWTQLSPTHSPSERGYVGMTFDAIRSQVVQFGGTSNGDSLYVFGDTWTWDGTDWTQRPAGSIEVQPRSGAPGTVVTIEGWGFAAREGIRLTFLDSVQGRVFLEKVKSDATGAFTAQVTIPLGATLGRQHVKAKGVKSGQIAKRPFIVT